MYREPDGATKPVQDLDKVCARIPVSIMFGGENDYMYDAAATHPNLTFDETWCCRPRGVQDALVDKASGRRFSSITRIDGAGHLVCRIHTSLQTSDNCLPSGSPAYSRPAWKLHIQYFVKRALSH